MRAFIFKANSFNFYSKSASLELRIWLAPSFFNNSTCYSRRTMFIICTPSGGKNLFNILPKEEAAALTITVFIFFDSAISSIAIAVKGFTNWDLKWLYNLMRIIRKYKYSLKEIMRTINRAKSFNIHKTRTHNKNIKNCPHNSNLTKPCLPPMTFLLFPSQTKP